MTGGAGFIGTNFIYRTLANHPDWEVVCLDALTYAGHLPNLDKARRDNRFKFVKGDISDRETVFGLFKEERFDSVVNFAAESHVDRSINEPALFLISNVIGTQVLLDACRRNDVSRYHQVSTDEVYGDLPLDRPDLLFKEDSPIRPSSPYSASKAAADLCVLAYYRTYGIKTTISRCSNNYGPYQHPEKLIPKTIMLAVADCRIPLYGPGLNVRDWIHVDDHCAAVDVILRKGKPGDVYNIGSRNERTNLDIVRTILAQLGRTDDSIEHVSDRPGHDRRYAIDPTKIETELGWKPINDFYAALEKTVRWYIENQKWIEEVNRRLQW